MMSENLHALEMVKAKGTQVVWWIYPDEKEFDEDCFMTFYIDTRQMMRDQSCLDEIVEEINLGDADVFLEKVYDALMTVTAPVRSDPNWNADKTYLMHEEHFHCPVDLVCLSRGTTIIKEFLLPAKITVDFLVLRNHHMGSPIGFRLKTPGNIIETVEAMLDASLAKMM